MTWTMLRSSVAAGSAAGFSDALDIWINKPHVLNRRLCGACLLWRQTISTKFSIADCLVPLEVNIMKFADTEHLEAVIQACLVEGGGQSGNYGDDPTQRDLEVIIRDLHPKQLDKFLTQREIILLDRDEGCAIFMPLLQVDSTSHAGELSSDLCYRLNYCEHDQSINLAVKDSSRAEGAQSTTLEWLRDQFVTRIAHWSLQDNLNTSVTSLRLVPMDRYNRRYHKMKTSYGPQLVKDWPESTDPQKFVYEDIAIAAYLLTLWDIEREERNQTIKQSFVDLGCGNGLLVHLLAREGHPGMGIDLRRRHIWDFYGPETTLKELALCPSDENLFPEHDWLIGNHSDELTPWIPVIAARSSAACRFFVLPCCAHDFDAKFREKRQGLSQYRCYLDYVYKVGEVCGFKVEEDTLRIPSTKRVCFIGKTRTYLPSEEKSINDNITDFIKSRCTQSHKRKLSSCESEKNIPPNKSRGVDDVTPSRELDTSQRHCNHNSNDDLGSNHDGGQGQSQGQQSWAGEFRTRSGEEVQRNCLTVAKVVIEEIVTNVFSAVLAVEGGRQLELPDGRTWNCGGSLPLASVATMFDGSLLRQLKSEHGGLQTLLRNNYHIFRVQGGKVHLRDMGAQDEEHWERKKKYKAKRKLDPSSLLKTRLCYFHEHHPDGCPKAAGDCRFAHGTAELQKKTQ